MLPYTFETDMVNTVRKNMQLKLKEQLEAQIERLTTGLRQEKDRLEYYQKEVARSQLNIDATEIQINTAVARLLKLQEGMN